MPLAEALIQYRKRLLDLSLRNRLLNFKPSKRFTILVESPLADVYGQLFDEKGEVPLRHRPDPDLLGTPPVPPARSVLTAHLAADLERRCSNIRKESSRLERESGINHLQLLVGMLTWYEADDSERAIRAPLLTVPLRINTTAGAHGASRFSISFDGTQVAVNPCLAEKMREFGIQLPPLQVSKAETDEEDADAVASGDPQISDVLGFLHRVEELLKKRADCARWMVQDNLQIAFLSFAKLRMYLDLDPAQWPSGKGVDLNPLIKGIFGENDEEREPMTPLGVLLDEEIEKHPVADALPIVVEADSSQHAAIAAAVAGTNLVIQGPPGTGKSQTITNIIAGLIHAGKTVLFVAAKKAALDVVRRNLDEAKLSDFVLQLHGDKAGKVQLYQDLAQRIGYTPPVPGAGPTLRRDWQASRAKLNGYVSAMKRPAGPEGELFPTLIGKMQQLRGDIPETPLGLELAAAPAEAFTPRLELLSRCESTLTNDLFGKENPWRVHSASDVAAGFEIDRYLSHLRNAVAGIVAAKNRVTLLLGTEVSITLADCLKLAPEALDHLYHLPQGVLWDIKGSLGKADNQIILDAAAERVARIVAAYNGAKSRIGDEERRTLSPHLLQALDQITEVAFFQDPAEAISMPNVRSLVTSLGELRKQAEQMAAVALPLPTNLQEMQLAKDRLRLLQSLPPTFAGEALAVHFQETTSEILAEAKGASAALIKRRDALAGIFRLTDSLPSVVEVRAVRQSLATHGESCWGRWFSKDYKASRATSRGWLVAPSEYKYPDILDALEKLEAWLRDVAKFEHDPRVEDALGKSFAGLETDWARLEALVAWCGQAKVLGLSHEGVAAYVSRQNVQQVKSLESAIWASLSEARAAYANLKDHGLFAGSEFEVCPLETMDAHFGSWLPFLDAYIAPLQTQRVGKSLTLSQLRGALMTWATVDSEKTTLAGDSTLAGYLGHHFAGFDTNWDAVETTRSWIAGLRAGPLPKAWIEKLLLVADPEVWRQALVEILGVYQGATDAAMALTAIAQVLPSFGAWAVQPRLEDLVTALAVYSEKTEMLSRWTDFCQLRKKGNELGLGTFFDWMFTRKLDPKHVAKVFRSVEYSRAAQAFVAAHPEVRGFDLHDHEQCRDRFRALDRDLLKLHQVEIAQQVAARQVPVGNGAGTVGTWTDGALVRRQSRLKKSQVPIRQLMERASAAVRAYKPCFMLSPLAVAQFLPPTIDPFDVVVMDEASQILPEDALGAIARGKQLIVVGDKNQLPPTNFFNVSADDEEADQDNMTALELSKSILESVESCESFSHNCGLKWHYRSLHPSLIAFSNLEFYENKLLVFPTQGGDDCGIKYVYVDAGVYVGGKKEGAGTNRVEADAVVEAVAHHFMNGSSKHSLGIITFNLAQKLLIDDLLLERAAEDPVFRDAMEQASTGDEPFLNCNLESIQGEQRDVIFISCTYGPDTVGGQPAQRFGPVNQEAGPRRLNVMFSRSKRRMVIFSSMRPEQIQAEPGELTGRGYLRRFLQYAASGGKDLVSPITRVGAGIEPGSEFEHAVGEFLRSEGHQVDIQVGVAGFSIDIGIRHPRDTGRYLMGVECDGATYHSSKTARDRDRLREEVLRGRGWKLGRVWSTDWFRSRKSAQKQLLAKIAKALEEDSGYASAVSPVHLVSLEGVDPKDNRELFT